MPIPKSRYKDAKLLWHDPQRGMAAYWHWDPVEHKGKIEEVWDNKPVLNFMEGVRQQFTDHGQQGDLRFLGKVGLGEVMNWIKEGKMASGNDGILRVRDQKFVAKKLKDPKYRKFRSNHSGAI